MVSLRANPLEQRMIKNIYLAIVVVLLGCTAPEPGVKLTQTYYAIDTMHVEYLYSFSDEAEFTPGAPCGYRNIEGEIIIPKGKYSHCFTDTCVNFAFVSDEKLTNSKIVAIDRNENILFDAYIFDNGPDWLKDGLFRIVRSGKIGYADKNGTVIIEPKYECAEPFDKGVASVAFDCTHVQNTNISEHSAMVSGSWHCIDKKGKTLQ
jgi:hypothetical protein